MSLDLPHPSHSATWGVLVMYPTPLTPPPPQMVVSLVVPAATRVHRIGAALDSHKMESYVAGLKHEVELLGRMTVCMDAFLGMHTRLCVIVDGLDSCDQGRLLQVTPPSPPPPPAYTGQDRVTTSNLILLHFTFCQLNPNGYLCYLCRKAIQVTR